MKAIIKHGTLVDAETGLNIYMNKSDIYKDTLESFTSLKDDTEVEISNCYRSESLKNSGMKILYGSNLSFNILNEHLLIDTEGDDSNELTGISDSDINSGISDSGSCNDIQNESESSEQISGDNPE